jgi:hypothetical protein
MQELSEAQVMYKAGIWLPLPATLRCVHYRLIPFAVRAGRMSEREVTAWAERGVSTFWPVSDLAFSVFSSTHHNNKPENMLFCPYCSNNLVIGDKGTDEGKAWYVGNHLSSSRFTAKATSL